jgi:hypothetical protein
MHASVLIAAARPSTPMHCPMQHRPHWHVCHDTCPGAQVTSCTHTASCTHTHITRHAHDAHLLQVKGRALLAICTIEADGAVPPLPPPHCMPAQLVSCTCHTGNTHHRVQHTATQPPVAWPITGAHHASPQNVPTKHNLLDHAPPPPLPSRH